MSVLFTTHCPKCKEDFTYTFDSVKPDWDDGNYVNCPVCTEHILHESHHTSVIDEEAAKTEPRVKVSFCQCCNAVIEVAGEKELLADTKMRNEFKNNVFKYDLRVETMPISKWRTHKGDIGCQKDNNGTASIS